jgi:hypothetical protein
MNKAAREMAGRYYKLNTPAGIIEVLVDDDKLNWSVEGDLSNLDFDKLFVAVCTNWIDIKTMSLSDYIKNALDKLHSDLDQSISDSEEAEKEEQEYENMVRTFLR